MTIDTPAAPSSHTAHVVIGGTLRFVPVLLTPGYTTKHDVDKIVALGVLGSLARRDEVLVERLTCRTCQTALRLDSLDTTGQCEPCALGEEPRDVEHDSTCGTCGRTWSSEETPTPAARCPFEYDHEDEDEDEDPVAQERAADEAARAVLQRLLYRSTTPVPSVDGLRTDAGFLSAAETDALYRAIDALDH